MGSALDRLAAEAAGDTTTTGEVQPNFDPSSALDRLAAQADSITRAQRALRRVLPSPNVSDVTGGVTTTAPSVLGRYLREAPGVALHAVEGIPHAVAQAARSAWQDVNTLAQASAPSAGVGAPGIVESPSVLAARRAQAPSPSAVLGAGLRTGMLAAAGPLSAGVGGLAERYGANAVIARIMGNAAAGSALGAVNAPQGQRLEGAGLGAVTGAVLPEVVTGAARVVSPIVRAGVNAFRSPTTPGAPLAPGNTISPSDIVGGGAGGGQSISAPVPPRGAPPGATMLGRAVPPITPDVAPVVPATPPVTAVTSPIPSRVAPRVAPAASAPIVPEPLTPQLAPNLAPPMPEDAVESSHVVTVPTSSIRVDPARFQFKQGLNPATGAGPELANVSTFNPDFAGTLSVWRDPENGGTYIVNGHHRLALANRFQVPTVDVRYLDAANAPAARAKGALINIAEGRGTPTDAAQFFRDTGLRPEDVAAQGVSMRGAVAAKGLALSNLAPDLFNRVVTGDVPEETGVAIGRVLDHPEQQRAAAELVARGGRRLSPAEVENVARQVRDAGSEAITQESLFGPETTALSLAVPRARLAESVFGDLAKDARLFGYVCKEGRASELARGGNTINVEQSGQLATESGRLAELFHRLSTRAGPVGDLLTEGARTIAQGGKLAQVKADIAPRLRAAVSEALRGGEGIGARAGEGHASQGTVAPEGPGEPGYRGSGPAENTETGLAAPEQGGGLFAGSTTTSTTPAPNLLRDIRPLGSTPARDLFGENVPVPGETAPTPQGSLFDAGAGQQAQNLAATEARYRAELPQLRWKMEHTTDASTRLLLASKVAEMERLVNRANAISPAELRARRLSGEGVTPALDALEQSHVATPALDALDRTGPPAGPPPSSGADLFDERFGGLPVGQRLRQAIGRGIREMFSDRFAMLSTPETQPLKEAIRETGAARSHGQAVADLGVASARQGIAAPTVKRIEAQLYADNAQSAADAASARATEIAQGRAPDAAEQAELFPDAVTAPTRADVVQELRKRAENFRRIQADAQATAGPTIRQSPEYKQYVERYKLNVEPEFVNAAAGVGITGSKLRPVAPGSAYVPFAPDVEAGTAPAATSVGVSRGKLGTRTSSAAQTATGAAPSYGYDVAKNVAQTLPERLRVAGGNRMVNEVAKLGRRVINANAPVPEGMTRIKITDSFGLAPDAGTARTIDVPDDVADALTVARQRFNPGPPNRLQRGLSTAVHRLTGLDLALRPAVFVAHGIKNLGGLAGQAPSSSALDNLAASVVPGYAKLQGGVRLATADVMDPENVRALLNLSRTGGLHPVATGNGIMHVTARPLFGARGLDMRTRLVLDKLMRKAAPGLTDAARSQAITELAGNYVNELQPAFQHFGQNTGLTSFAPAGVSFVRGSVRRLVGAPLYPGQTLASRLATMGRLGGAGLASLEAWNIANTGHSTFQNEPGHRLDVDRGTKDKQGREQFWAGSMVAPLFERALRATGAEGVINSDRPADVPVNVWRNFANTAMSQLGVTPRMGLGFANVSPYLTAAGEAKVNVQPDMRPQTLPFRVTQGTLGGVATGAAALGGFDPYNASNPFAQRLLDMAVGRVTATGRSPRSIPPGFDDKLVGAVRAVEDADPKERPGVERDQMQGARDAKYPPWALRELARALRSAARRPK